MKTPFALFVVGRHTRTTYGPFEAPTMAQAEALAQAFIRHDLRSSNRYYETAVETPKAARKAACNRMIVPASAFGPRS